MTFFPHESIPISNVQNAVGFCALYYADILKAQIYNHNPPLLTNSELLMQSPLHSPCSDIITTLIQVNKTSHL